MDAITYSSARANLARTMDRVCEDHEALIITRNGKPAAVLLVPADEEDLDRLMLARSPRFQAMLEESRRSIAAGKGLSRDDFWKSARRRRDR